MRDVLSRQGGGPLWLSDGPWCGFSSVRWDVGDGE